MSQRNEKISNKSSFGIIDIAESSTTDRIIVIVQTPTSHRSNTQKHRHQQASFDRHTSQSLVPSFESCEGETQDRQSVLPILSCSQRASIERHRCSIIINKHQDQRNVRLRSVPPPMRLSELAMVCIKESSKDLEHQLVRKPWCD